MTRKDFLKKIGLSSFVASIGLVFSKINTKAMVNDNLGYTNEDRSYVGMIIHSSIFSTMDQVISFYGGTKWIQHSGYILRGATSGVKTNRASKDGGEDTHKLTINEMPSHTHVQNAHNHGDVSSIGTNGTRYIYTDYTGTGSGSNFILTRAVSTSVSNPLTTKNATATNQNTGGSAAHNNMQSYKNVYIWERVE